MTEINPLLPMELRAGACSVHIRGDGFYVSGQMPVLPRKGDVLFLGSLCKLSPDDDWVPREVLVSRVEFYLDQISNYPSYWIIVRRIAPRAERKK